MNAGQASAEYAGLLGLAAVIGATLALTTGGPLAGAVRDALASALSSSASTPTQIVVTAADIADVQSALLGGENQRTPDAALIALTQRRAGAQAESVASSVLLIAARATTPWLGTGRVYRAWLNRRDGPFEPMPGLGDDRDVEQPTGPPVATWVTVAGQQRAVEAALAHHPNVISTALDLIGLIPEGSLLGLAGRVGSRSVAKAAITNAPDALDGVRKVVDAIEVVEPDDGDIPAGMRAGDVVVAWPVRRSAWRGGEVDVAPRQRIALRGFQSVPLPRDYVHFVFLRPGAHGLAVIAQGLGT